MPASDRRLPTGRRCSWGSRTGSARQAAALAGVLVAGCWAGCGDRPKRAEETNPRSTLIPLTVGPGPAFRPARSGASAAAGAAPVHGLACGRRPRRRTAAHLELFARRHVVLIPPGVGVAPPLHSERARVQSGRCWYPLATADPSGLIEIGTRRPVTLGDFFDLWGQPLSRRRLLSFRAPPRSAVRGFVGGRPWRGNLRHIPLTRHAVVVVEVSGYVPPHHVYRYPPGL